MWTNYIRIALRSMRKNKAFNAINLAGLAIGLASAIFILLYITSETRYDRFHERAEDIYRLYVDGKMQGDEFKGAWNSPIVGPTFAEEIPEIEAFCRFDFYSDRLMWVDPENKFLENAVMLADSSFFDVFSIRLLEGDPKSCLKEPNTILLSESRAKQYFPEGDHMGKSIAMNDESNLFRVTGVVEDCPRYSHFTYNFIASYSSDSRANNTFWFNNWMMTYILVRPGTDQDRLHEKMKASLYENIRAQLKQFMGITPEEFEAAGNQYGIKGQALLEIHMDQEIDLPNGTGYRPLGNKRNLVVFGIIAFFILVIASINFMNLSTARSLARAKEVSLRKVVGSERKHLVQQFLLESVLLSLMALGLGLMLVLLLLQPFNSLVGLDLDSSDLLNIYMLPAFVVLAILVGLLSGSYPSFVLSSFRPIFALKGNASARNGTTVLRNALVVVQFSISMIIIASTLVIYWQFRFMSQKEPGFDKEQMLVLERLYPLGDQLQTFKEELLGHSAILKATNSTATLGSTNSNSTFGIKGRPMEESAMFYVYYTDEDFMDTYQFELATPDSRFLSRDFPSDSSACLINEAAVRKYALEDPLNTILLRPSDEGFEEELRVIGVVKDHHFQNIKEEISTQIIMLKPESWNWSGYITLKLSGDAENVESALAFVEETWKGFTDDQPLQYFFLDEQLESFYAEEKRTGALTMIFSILAIFIASLGLFGLTLYNSQKRIREIGIRKVMGATEGNIINVVSKGTGYAVGASILIAMPVAYFMMQDWLRDFPYNVGFQPLLFLSAALLAVIIALVTVTSTSLKAARTNPAVALHYE